MTVDKDGKLLAMVILRNLLFLYENFITTLGALGDHLELLRLETLKSRWLEEEQRRVFCKTAAVEEDLFGFFNRYAKNCFYCHSTSFFCKETKNSEDHCWITFPSLRPKQNKAKSSTTHKTTFFMNTAHIHENLLKKNFICLFVNPFKKAYSSMEKMQLTW